MIRLRCHHRGCDKIAREGFTMCFTHWPLGVRYDKHRETQLTFRCICKVCKARGAKMKFHPTITQGRVCEAIERAQYTTDNPGFCLACGEDAEGVEPDAQGYTCESCEESEVWGAEALLFIL